MSQQAILLKAVGQALTLVTDHPIAKPKDLQVLVKVTMAGLNGHDQKVRDMGIFLSGLGLPAVLGNDVIGVVASIGKGVTSLKKGDRVISQADFAHGTPQNGLQQYAVLDEEFTAKVPDGVSDHDAATLPTNLIAALVGLYHDLKLSPPWTKEADRPDYSTTKLLIVGGGSISGRYATQLAKLAGVGNVVVVGGKETELKSYGATHVIDRHGGQEAVLERIRAVVGDHLIYAFDAVNMPDGQLLALNALSSHTKGSLTRLLPLGVDSSKVLGKKAGFEILDVLGISGKRPELCREFWKRLPGYLERGHLIPIKEGYTVVSEFSATGVNGVLDTFRRGEVLKHAHVVVDDRSS